jgi:hypothetical protein
MNILLRAHVRSGNKKPVYIGVFANYDEAAKAAIKIAPPPFPPTQPTR